MSTLSMSSSELIGKHHSTLVGAGERQSASYTAFWDQLRLGVAQSGEFQRFGKDGRTVWLQATYTPILGLGGRVTRVVKFASDITAAKLVSADHLGKIEAIERVQAVIEFGLDGTVLGANANFLELMGYGLEEVKGRPHSIFVTADQRGSSDYVAFWNQLRKGVPQAAEFCRVTKDGRHVWIQASYNPVRNPAGEVMKVVKFATDITAAKRRAAEHDGQVNAISRVQAVIEFALDGTVLWANETSSS